MLKYDIKQGIFSAVFQRNDAFEIEFFNHYKSMEWETNKFVYPAGVLFRQDLHEKKSVQ